MIVQAFSAAMRANGGLAAAGAAGSVTNITFNITAFDPNGFQTTIEEKAIPIITDALRLNLGQARTKIPERA